MSATLLRGARVLVGSMVTLGLFSSCAPEFDTARKVTPTGTLGEEVFRVVCERVHVGESPLDVTFDRGRVPCTRGLSATAPAPTGVGRKTVALGRMRTDIASALDQSMPRVTYTPLDGLLINLLPLYGGDGTNRRDAMGRSIVSLADGGTTVGEDLLPQTTRSVAGLLRTMSTDQPALIALGRMSWRRGYRPARSAAGVLRPVLGYAQVDEMLDHTLRVLRDPSAVAPAGSGNAQFNTALSVLRGEFSQAGPSTETTGGTTLDATIDLLLNRQDPILSTGQPIEIVRRDVRGVAMVNVSADGAPAPFIDQNRDGLADVHPGLGCYIDAMNQCIDPPTPFPTRFAPAAMRTDAQAHPTTAAGAPLYRYIDLNPSALATIARQFPPLLRVQNNNVPALQLLHGSSVMFGARAQATRMYGAQAVTYSQYTAEGAPVVDLVHASGVLLSHRDVVPVLNTTRALLATDREQVTARLIGAVLNVDAISDRYPDVTMDARANLWDDVMDVVKRIAQEPGLLEDILDAVAQMQRPLTNAPPLWESSCAGTVPIQNISRAFASYARNRDRLNPDWSGNFNAHVTREPSVPVDRMRPDTQNLRTPGAPDDNRSLLQRILHLVDDLNGARMCNKNHAAVRIRFNVPLLGAQAIGVPGAGDLAECGLVEIPDAATFFVRAIAGEGRAVMPMNLPGLLGTVTDIARRFGVNLDNTLDGLVQSQSGITGFNSQPSPFGVARMVFQPNPNAFVTDLLDPPMIRNSEGLSAAGAPERAVRNAHAGTIFSWESNCFYDSFRPLVLAFVKHDRRGMVLDPRLGPGENPSAMAPANIDTSRGSKLLADLISAFHRHWATRNAGDYQSATQCATCRDGRNYSAMSGASRYEPIIAETLASDLMPALAEASTSLRTLNAGNGVTGTRALSSLVRGLVDPNAVALDGRPGFPLPVAYRNGATSTVRSDGTTRVAQASVYHLFADAFNAMDPLLEATPPKRESWQAARSALVDQLLTVDGSGTGANFRNRATPALLRLIIAWAQDRIAAHTPAMTPTDPNMDERVRWSWSLGRRLGETVRGPAFASALDVSLALYDDVPARTNTATLLTRVLDDTAGPDSSRHATPFATTVSSIADLLQIMRADGDVDPLLHALAPAFEPRTGTVARSLGFLDRARASDTDHVLVRVLGNMVQRPAGSDPIAPEPLSVLADAIADTHRGEPGQHGPLAPMDFHYVFTQVADFFSDNRRGMEQFYYIVQHRRLP